MESEEGKCKSSRHGRKELRKREVERTRTRMHTLAHGALQVNLELALSNKKLKKDNQQISSTCLEGI